MNKRQGIAYDSPCARGFETLQEKFWQPEFYAGRNLSTILTVNK